MTDRMPNPRPPVKHPPLMDLSFAALGWVNRAAQAVGSDRFAESVNRSRFYIARAEEHAATPAERAVIEGLYFSVDLIIEANAKARTMLAESCQEMAVADLVEFTERIDGPATDDEDEPV